MVALKSHFPIRGRGMVRLSKFSLPILPVHKYRPSPLLLSPSFLPSSSFLPIYPPCIAICPNIFALLPTICPYSFLAISLASIHRSFLPSTLPSIWTSRSHLPDGLPERLFIYTAFYSATCLDIYPTISLAIYSNISSAIYAIYATIILDIYPTM
jgi:hypothetical protein